VVIVCCAISLNHALSPFRLQEVSVLFEPNFGHLRFHITDLPPQQRSPSERKIVRGFDLTVLQQSNHVKKKMYCLLFFICALPGFLIS